MGNSTSSHLAEETPLDTSKTHPLSSIHHHHHPLPTDFTAPAMPTTTDFTPPALPSLPVVPDLPPPPSLPTVDIPIIQSTGFAGHNVFTDTPSTTTSSTSSSSTVPVVTATSLSSVSSARGNTPPTVPTSASSTTSVPVNASTNTNGGSILSSSTSVSTSASSSPVADSTSSPASSGSPSSLESDPTVNNGNLNLGSHRNTSSSSVSSGSSIVINGSANGSGSSDTASTQLSPPAIIGIVFALITLIGLVIFFFKCLSDRKRRSTAKKELYKDFASVTGQTAGSATSFEKPSILPLVSKNSSILSKSAQGSLPRQPEPVHVVHIDTTQESKDQSKPSLSSPASPSCRIPLKPAAVSTQPNGPFAKATLPPLLFPLHNFNRDTVGSNTTSGGESSQLFSSRDTNYSSITGSRLFSPFIIDSRASNGSSGAFSMFRTRTTTNTLSPQSAAVSEAGTTITFKLDQAISDLQQRQLQHQQLKRGTGISVNTFATVTSMADSEDCSSPTSLSDRIVSDASEMMNIFKKRPPPISPISLDFATSN